ICPVIALKSDHYNNKQYGKTYVPIFEVVDWMTMDGVAASEPAEDEPAKEEPKEAPKVERSKRSERTTAARTDKVDDQTRAATKEELEAIAAAQQGGDASEGKDDSAGQPDAGEGATEGRV